MRFFARFNMIKADMLYTKHMDSSSFSERTNLERLCDTTPPPQPLSLRDSPFCFQKKSSTLYLKKLYKRLNLKKNIPQLIGRRACCGTNPAKKSTDIAQANRRAKNSPDCFLQGTTFLAEKVREIARVLCSGRPHCCWIVLCPGCFSNLLDDIEIEKVAQHLSGKQLLKKVLTIKNPPI